MLFDFYCLPGLLVTLSPNGMQLLHLNRNGLPPPPWGSPPSAFPMGHRRRPQRVPVGGVESGGGWWGGGMNFAGTFENTRQSPNWSEEYKNLNILSKSCNILNKASVKTHEREARNYNTKLQNTRRGLDIFGKTATIINHSSQLLLLWWSLSIVPRLVILILLPVSITNQSIMNFSNIIYK